MNYKTVFILILGLSLVACDMQKFYEQFMENGWTDVDGWGYYNSYRGVNIINTCGIEKLIGGRGVFGARSGITKSFKLPPHHSAQIKFQFWKMDSWDNEKFQVYIDDKIVFEKNYQVAQGENICNNVNGWNTLREDIDVKVAHINPTLIVVMTSTLDEHADNVIIESFGFKNFQLFIDRCPANCNACMNSNQDSCLMWDIVSSFWTKDDTLGNEGWIVDGGKDAGYSCAGIQMFGGFNNFGKNAKLIKKLDLPPHYRIKIKLTYFKIDSWDGHEGWISVEGERIWKRAFGYNEVYKLCGVAEYTWKSIFVGVDAEVAHTKGNVNIVISSDLDEAPDNESFGVRDFFLYIARCAKACDICLGPNESDCTKCKNNWSLQNGKCQPLVNFVTLEQSFMEKKFTGLDGWTLENTYQNRIFSECDGYSLVGGFNVFGAKAMARKSWNVPKHKRIRIQVQMWKIDSWDGEFLFIDVDSARIWQKTLSFASGGQQLCGRQDSNWNEIILDVDEIFFHDQPQINVFISSTLDQAADDESWGFREFRISYEAQAECAIFYSECDYKGAAFEFCDDSSNFKKDSIPPAIRSIRVPPQGRVTLYEKPDFGGKRVVYTTSQPCINSFDFNFLQLKVESVGKWIEI